MSHTHSVKTQSREFIVAFLIRFGYVSLILIMHISVLVSSCGQN